MRKLPSSTARYVLPLILTFFMTCVVSGLSTYLAIGGQIGWLGTWGRSWISSWIVAFPVMVVFMPVAQRVLRLIVDLPKG